MSHRGAGFEAEQWKEVSRIYRRAMGLALGRKSGRAEVGEVKHATNNEAEMLDSAGNETVLPDLRMAAMLMKRVRYFTDGAGTRNVKSGTILMGSRAWIVEIGCG